MRELLFKGKRKDNGEWVTSNTIYQCNGEIKLWDEPNRDGYVAVIPETVGQYTGLTDKNGKKIFEGDIMQLCSACYPCLVYWDGKGWAWKQNGKRREIDLTREKMDTIGNIYENKELLEAEELTNEQIYNTVIFN